MLCLTEESRVALCSVIQLDSVIDLVIDEEEMSEIRKRLEMCIRVVPDDVKNGSVQNVQRWKTKAEHAAKLLKNPRASVQDLEEALFDLQRNHK